MMAAIAWCQAYSGSDNNSSYEDSDEYKYTTYNWDMEE